MPPTRPEVLIVPATLVDYRLLMKKVEHLVAEIDSVDDVGTTIHCVAERIFEHFHDELGLIGGRIYRRSGELYVLQRTFGQAKSLPSGFTIERTYPPIQACLERGIVYMEPEAPGLDRALEEGLGVRKFACIEVGDEASIIAFDVAPGHGGEDVLFSLGILRHSINLKLREERMEGIFRQARRIQTSILPRSVPRFPGYDLAGRNVPVESVGGDFYDYLPITDKVMGLAMADVSGHGLPAALQVRDIHMGLRMGMARDFKIVRTVEHLNRIIHESTLTSRFVALFYGELETNGALIYVNAGHVPPVVLRSDGRVEELRWGGAVLGPLANGTYERGFTRLEADDLVLLYTDGIADSMSQEGVEYGVDRIIAAAARLRERSAKEIVAGIFADLAGFLGENGAEDDRTLVVVKRLGGPEPSP